MKRAIPVIHVESGLQAEHNLRVALEAGADGVFLINHTLYGSDLNIIFRWLRSNNPKFWIGVNYLDLPPLRAAQLSIGASGLWMDSYPKSPLGLDIPVFGGVAFKHQPPRGALADEVAMVSPTVDVLVTSGPATGHAPDLSKVQALRELTDKPIGIASGLTPSNVRQFLPYADYFMVATGVSNSFTELNAHQVAQFVQAVHAA